MTSSSLWCTCFHILPSVLVSILSFLVRFSMLHEYSPFDAHSAKYPAFHIQDSVLCVKKMLHINVSYCALKFTCLKCNTQFPLDRLAYSAWCLVCALDCWGNVLRFPAGASRPVLEPTKNYFVVKRRRWDGRGVKLTTHLHLVPTLRMSGSKPPLPTRLHGVHMNGFACTFCPLCIYINIIKKDEWY
jgi:hypothetical protein